MPQISLTANKDNLIKKFSSLSSAQDVADLLEIKSSLLNYYLFVKPLDSNYKVFSISKKRGGERKISTPVTALKIIQRKLNIILSHIYNPKPSVHGLLNRSIVSNAEAHSKKKYVFNIDLKDFYPSINFGRVRGMFMAYPYKLNPPVATILAQICILKDELPQGAPTSPIISNMICAKMDSELQLLAKEQRCNYSRYADDITFSTSLPKFPISLAEINLKAEIEVGNKLRDIIQRNGFDINSNKVRLDNKFHRQSVTGLIVNKFPNVTRKFKNQIRAMLHAWDKYGIEKAQTEFEKKWKNKNRNPDFPYPRFEDVVKGKIEYIGMVRGRLNPIYKRFRKELKNLDPNIVIGIDSPLEEIYYDYEFLLKMKDHKKRGFELEKLLNKLFKLSGITTIESFKRNKGAEQIDGAIMLESWNYLIECKWTKKPSDTKELDSLNGKMGRSGSRISGIFISINGWSSHVPKMLKENPKKNIILFDGNDLISVLCDEIELRKLIEIKSMMLSFKAMPYYSAKECVAYLKNEK